MYAVWGDLLTAYGGQGISYDTIGNPLSDGTWTYTWKHGRQLASASNGTTTWTYTYDANGMRVGRTNGVDTYTYVYNGDQLVQMTKGSNTLYFTYCAAGPATVTWNGTTYYYALNGQGDVVGIFTETGSCAVLYYWDNAWGRNPTPQGSLASTLGTLNPLRYRGYVYDQETKLYYLQSRYYNAQNGRFISPDAFVSTGQGLLGNNMFAYCLNNPVIRYDPSGTVSMKSLDFDTDELLLPFKDAIGGGVAALAIGVAVSSVLLSQSNQKKPVNLPSGKKVKLDMDHISSGHMPDGDRNPDGNKSVFWGMTSAQVAKAIYEAYNASSKLQSQGSRIKLIGYSNTFNLIIEMWINITTKIIETAYPK